MRVSPWFLKRFGQRVEEDYFYDLVKPNSTVKTRTKVVTYVAWYFRKMEKLSLETKFEISK